MPIYDLDTDQRKAAVSACAEIAVSAGAGSGKTRLLVARYLHYIMKDRLPLNAIAAITFTNKASDQMKARVAARARELAAENPADAAFWQKVAAGVHHAPISTIHSFCGGIIRAHPVEVGIDPAFAILDEVTNAEIRALAVDSFVLKRQTEVPDDMAFLIDVFGIAGLKQMYHSMLRSRSHVLKFIDMIEHDGGLDEASFGKLYLKSQIMQVRQYLHNLEDFHAFRPADDGFVPDYELFVTLLRDLVTMLETDSVDPCRIEIEIGMLNFRRGSGPKWGAEQLKNLKGQMKECRELLQKIAIYKRLENDIVPKAASLVLREYVLLDAAYLKRKKALSYLDNDDILIETWRLLRSNVRLCRKISHSFKHILVDEFQDTDGIQMDILNMIAGNSSAALFTVGDPKQSIYRFRGADVSVFNEFVGRTGTEFHRLTTNYRSKASVMAFVNTAFEQIIGTEPSYTFEAVYSAMKPFRKDPDDDGPAVDIFVIDSPAVASQREMEAELIAQRILTFRDSGISGKQYRYSDMAILLRKGTSVDCYEEALMRSGIPFVNRIGGRLAGNPAAYDIGNLLAWLNDPGNPALLTAVLLSPFVGFDADAVFRLRRLAGSADAMSSWLLGARSDGDTMFDPASALLSDLLLRVNRVHIRSLIEHAFDRSGYTLHLLADNVRGERSLAVTDLLLETADRFEENGGSSAGFAELLLSGQEFTTETAHVETGEDAVPILTIHGAKGLEFPIVFLADIPSGSKGGNGDAVLFDDDLGPGFKIRNDRGVSDDTYPNWYANRENRRRDTAESKRLFYVGCTRAEDYLVILGKRPKTADGLYEKNNWMAWLHASLGIPADGTQEAETTDLYRLRRVSVEDEEYNAAGQDIWRAALDASKAPATVAVRISETLIADIPQVPASGLPAVLSPTRIIEYRACPARYYYRHVHGLDLSSAGGSGSSAGAAYGTFAHSVMERIDMHDPEGWARTAEVLYDPSLPQKMLASLTEGLVQFADSDLYRSVIRPADEIRREEPFVLLLGEVLLRGTIDLMCRNNGEIAIIDYKTTANVPESPEGIPDEYRFQLGLYGLAVFKAMHVVPSKLVLQYVGAGKSFDLPCSRQYLNDIEARLHEIVGRMAEGDFTPARGERCAVCPYGYLCEL